MKNKLLLSFIIGLFLLLPSGIMAEDFDQQNQVKEVIVDKEANTLTYVFYNNADKYADEIANLPQYSDIPNNAWYKSYVSHLSQLGIIDGIAPDKFGPNQNITRAEFVKMITMATNMDLANYDGETLFSDVSPDEWYAPYIQWATENGILEGFNESTFDPNKFITREAASTMMYRLYELQESDIIIEKKGIYRLESPAFSDESSISPWAVESIEQLKEASIIEGNENGEINPQNNISRSEAAKILSTYIILDTRPTLITDSGSVSYIGPGEEEKRYIEEHPEIDDNKKLKDLECIENIESVESIDSIESLEVNDENNLSGEYHLNWWANYIDDDNDLHPDWYSTHYRITERGFRILFAEKSSSITNLGEWRLSGNYKYSGRAQDYVLYGSVIPDDDEDGWGGTWHYYQCGDPGEEGRGKILGFRNAYDLFNDHYWDALYNFNTKRDYQAAYLSLGRAIHYLSDINQPYHAYLQSNDDTDYGHKRYEIWIDDNWGKNGWESQYNENSAGDATYSYMTNTSTLDICNNFSQLACDNYENCSKGFNFKSNAQNPAEELPSEQVRNASKPYTAEQLKRNQRAVAGLLYAYLVRTGRNW